MNKQRKIQLTILITMMVLLIAFCLYVIGKSVYDFKERTDKRDETIEKFNLVYEKEGTQILLFASPTCQWCKKFVSILNEVSIENNFKYEYLDVSTFFQEDIEALYKKLDLKYEGIPHLVIIKDKKVVESQVGAMEKGATIEFLKGAGIIKGDVENDKSVSTDS